MTAVIQTARQHDHRAEREYHHYRRGTQPRVATSRSQPNYVARRFVAVLLVAAMLALAGVSAVAVSAIAGAMLDVGGRPAAASDIGSVDTAIRRVHVAQPGDTLWSIADSYRGEVSRSRYVDTLVDLNGGNAAIQVGQAVRLP